MIDLVDKIMAYETGEMTEDELVKFFGELVESGHAWTLQGAYGRQATALIAHGWIDADGTVLRLPSEEE